MEQVHLDVPTGQPAARWTTCSLCSFCRVSAHQGCCTRMRQRAQSSCQHIVLPCVGPHPSLPLACAPQQGMALTFLLCLDQVTLSIVACSRITLRHGRTSLQVHERAPEPCLAACMFRGTARSRSLPGTLSSVPSSGTHVESRPLVSLPRLHLLLVCQGACRCWPEASLVMGLPTSAHMSHDLFFKSDGSETR